jgi:hypothetical protein
MSTGAPLPFPVAKPPQETEALSYTHMEPASYEVQVSSQARRSVSVTCVQNRPSVHKRLHIKRHFISILITSPFESHCPECRGNVDEERLVGDVFPYASASPKAVCAMPFFARFRGTGGDLAMRIKEPLGSEAGGIVAIRSRVVVTLPEIREAQSSLGDEHPIVPVILGRGVWEGKGESRAPSEDFFNQGLYVRKARSIRKSWGA